MSILRQFIDLIFPPRCTVCRRFFHDEVQPDSTICPRCAEEFNEIVPPFCPICRRPFSSGIEENHVCERCLRKPPFYDLLGAPFLYKGTLMEAIHQFKYAGKSHLAESLGPVLASFAEVWLGNTNGFLTMPVPLHPRRLRERGFNQSLLLSRHVASRLGTDLDYLSLRRAIHTLPQTGLDKDQRRKNIRKAFALNVTEPLKDRDILLVDDVATTGNTLNECARILKRGGCGRVLALVLART